MNDIKRFRDIVLACSFAAILLLISLIRFQQPVPSGGTRSEYIADVGVQVKVTAAPVTPHANGLVDLTYHWTPAADFDRIMWNYRARVRLRGPDGKVLVTDDHYPARPTSMWRKNETEVYTRTVRLPAMDSGTAADIEVGLYERRRQYRKVRLPNSARDGGEFAVHAGHIDIQPPLLPPARLHFLDGWYNPERNAETGEIWRWMGDEGVCHVGNLRRDVDVFIKGEIPREPFERPSTVTVLLQGKPIARFTPPYGDFSRRIRVPAIQLGESSAVIFVIQVDQTFRPVESGSGADSRILGLHLTDFQVVPRLSPFVEVPS